MAYHCRHCKKEIEIQTTSGLCDKCYSAYAPEKSKESQENEKIIREWDRVNSLNDGRPVDSTTSMRGLYFKYPSKYEEGEGKDLTRREVVHRVVPLKTWRYRFHFKLSGQPKIIHVLPEHGSKSPDRFEAQDQENAMRLFYTYTRTRYSQIPEIVRIEAKYVGVHKYFDHQLQCDLKKDNREREMGPFTLPFEEINRRLQNTELRQYIRKHASQRARGDWMLRDDLIQEATIRICQTYEKDLQILKNLAKTEIETRLTYFKRNF